ncbi:hypothetical protein Ocin01_08860 [Orchesella cincta]|uniref:F-box domain-containing protein n=1 Tax=Orchesella cincta TaxID=48709 RepID=A0A1D2MXQ7_ORCCI|nr:hypothetical protein Ocin01_08860 [Orchesella cincta]
MSSTLEDSGAGCRSVLKSPNTNPYLPPEIWVIILGHLSASDVLSITNACDNWNELVATKKTFALLELALPLLNLNYQDILTCRRVRKDAKLSVDTLVENYSTAQYNFNFSHEESIPRQNFNAAIKEIDNAYLFETIFGTGYPKILFVVGENRKPGDNPFLTRSIPIHLNFPNDEAYAEMERMLTLFGHHVWNIDLWVESLENDEEELNVMIVPHLNARVSTNKLPQLLNLVPNLKTLHLICHGMESMEELRPEELPELKHLVNLSLEGWSTEKSLPISIIHRYGSQLTQLIDRSLLHDDQFTVEVLNKMLPNLRKLKVIRVSALSLTKLAKVTWKLEELALEALRTWRTNDLFAIINNFSKTLVQLQILGEIDSSSLSLDTIKEFFAGLFRYPCEALPKLKLLSLDRDFAQMEKYEWFWKPAPRMFRNIRELHFCKEDLSPDRIDETLVKKVFQRLPNVGRILHWSKRNDMINPYQTILRRVYIRSQ